MKKEKLNLFFFWRQILPIVEEIAFCLVACYRFLKNTGRKKWKNSAIRNIPNIEHFLIQVFVEILYNIDLSAASLTYTFLEKRQD